MYISNNYHIAITGILLIIQEIGVVKSLRKFSSL